MKDRSLFLLFGILQAVVLGLIVFFVLGITGVGRDTSILLSILFPLFTLIVEYFIYSKK